MGGAAIVALVLIVTAEVIVRNLFGFSLLVADEYAGYLGLAITFLGIPFALSEDALLRVDAVIHRVTGRPRALMDAVFNLISALVTLLITWQVYRLVSRSFERGTFASTPAETPLWIPQSIMLIGGLMVVAVALWKFGCNLRDLFAAAPAEGKP